MKNQTLINIVNDVEIHLGTEENYTSIGIHLHNCKNDKDLDSRIEDALETAERDLFPAVYLHD